MTWDFQSNSISDSVRQFRLIRKSGASEPGRTLTFAEVIRLWQTDGEFVRFYSNLLSASPFKGFRWETPPVTTDLIEREFEFVLLKSDALDRRVDQAAFAEHFKSGAEVVSFANLSGDASLVVPCPIADPALYGHLASFIRKAPESQIVALWSSVGKAMTDRISDTPVWLSTAGMGVSWLHVRLDSRPKYYGHAPYKTV